MIYYTALIREKIQLKNVDFDLICEKAALIVFSWIECLRRKELNKRPLQSADREITIENCIGQRFIVCRLSGKKLRINGILGNSLGSCLDSSTIIASGSAQNSTGDIMNDGTIHVHGSCGDSTGYGMSGGKIIYAEKKPFPISRIKFA